MLCRPARQPALLLACLLVCAPLTLKSNSLAAPPLNLPARESLQYTVEWRLITAGSAKLVWNGDMDGSRAQLRLESTGLISKFYRVLDEYSAVLRPDLCTSSSHMTALEGGRNRETSITYDGRRKKASRVEKDRAKNTVIDSREIDIPACVHDVVGGLYFLRTLELEPGQSTQVPVSDGKKSVMARVEAQQREEVKTPSGTHRTIRYEIFLFNNVLYRRPGHVHVWLTDDARRVPVQIRVRLPFAIGTINLQLEKEEP
ncbi:MAG TPA: DUF3108 domain-containing protein [Bryobacteraceae bacterium]|nr:DUF3108 domain-containing protein [Bryobacteraceae bacterium]